MFALALIMKTIVQFSTIGGDTEDAHFIVSLKYIFKQTGFRYVYPSHANQAFLHSLML